MAHKMTQRATVAVAGVRRQKSCAADAISDCSGGHAVWMAAVGEPTATLQGCGHRPAARVNPAHGRGSAAVARRPSVAKNRRRPFEARLDAVDIDL